MHFKACGRKLVSRRSLNAEFGGEDDSAGDDDDDGEYSDDFDC